MIYDILYMECAQEKCKKIYHLKCLALSTKQFEEMSEDYKASWRCPECMRSVPKGNNADTPVRGSTLNMTFTPSSSSCFVNTERGKRVFLDETKVEAEDRLLEELREFHLDMISRFEEQKREYALLLDKYVKTESELLEIKQTMKVVLEKANKVDLLEARIVSLLERNERFESAANKQSQETKESFQVDTDRSQKNNMQVVTQKGVATKPVSEAVEGKTVRSFANAVKQNKNMQNTKRTQKCEAMKPGGVDMNEKTIQCIDVENIIEDSRRNLGEGKNTERDGTWSLVNKRKSKYLNSDVQRGGSTQESEIKGIEKQKFLHVWRLQKDTTTENLEKFIRNIIKDVPIKIDKIKHKSERDYASFCIGLPESKYDQLCKPDIWPVNVEFCEWVWFRRTANHPSSKDNKV